MPDFGHNAEAILHQERLAMECPRRAFRIALSLFPAPPPAAHMLEALDTYAEGEPRYSPLRMAVADVVVFIRLHNDMAGFASVFGLTEGVLDQIFRVGMAIDRGASEEEIAYIMAN